MDTREQLGRLQPDLQWTKMMRFSLANSAEVLHQHEEAVTEVLTDPDTRTALTQLVRELSTLVNTIVFAGTQPKAGVLQRADGEPWQVFRVDPLGLWMEEYEATRSGHVVTLRGVVLGHEHTERYTLREVEQFFGDTPAAAVAKFVQQQEREYAGADMTMYAVSKALGAVTRLCERLGLPEPTIWGKPAAVVAGGGGNGGGSVQQEPPNRRRWDSSAARNGAAAGGAEGRAEEAGGGGMSSMASVTALAGPPPRRSDTGS